MNHLPYRAIALDLDGTLTNHDKVVTPKTREALLQAASQNVWNWLNEADTSYLIMAATS